LLQTVEIKLLVARDAITIAMSAMGGEITGKYGRLSNPACASQLGARGRHFLSGSSWVQAGQTQLSEHTGQWGEELELVMITICNPLQIIKY
jgi:hypothetical protein